MMLYKFKSGNVVNISKFSLVCYLNLSVLQRYFRLLVFLNNTIDVNALFPVVPQIQFYFCQVFEISLPVCSPYITCCSFCFFFLVSISFDLSLSVDFLLVIWLVSFPLSSPKFSLFHFHTSFSSINF